MGLQSLVLFYLPWADGNVASMIVYFCFKMKFCRTLLEALLAVDEAYFCTYSLTCSCQKSN